MIAEEQTVEWADCDMYQSELCAYYWFKHRGICRYKDTHKVQCLLGIDSEIDRSGKANDMMFENLQFERGAFNA